MPAPEDDSPLGNGSGNGEPRAEPTRSQRAKELLKDRYRAAPKDDSPQARQMGAAYQAAMEAVFSIVIAVLLGWWLDSWLDSAPWGVLAGATIGFAAFVLRLSRLRAALDPPGDPGADGPPASGDQQDPPRAAGEGAKNGES